MTLGLGASCTIDVAAGPGAAGERDGQLVVTDTSAAGSHTMALTVNGFWPNRGNFYPVATSRILDTRSGNGAPKGQVGPAKTLHLQVAGRGGVPSTNVSAVTLNLTVTGPTASGFVTAFPSNAARPTVSTINFPRGWTGANQVTVPLGSNGKVDLYNSSGSTSLIADVTGWFAAGDTPPAAGYGKTFQAAYPERLVDTRKSGGKIPANSWYEWDLTYGPTYDPSMTAMALTVTALNAGSTGYLSAYRPGTSPTATSTLNFRPGVITPNLAIVRTAPCGESWCGASGHPIVRFYNGSSRPVDILVDAVGFFTDTQLADGLRFRPLTPSRIIDTRKPLGTTPFGAAATHQVTAPSSVAGDDTYALAANVTAIKPTKKTFVTLWPQYSDLSRPSISQLNPSAGSTVANATIAQVGVGNKVNIYNSSGAVNLATDVAGSYEYFPPFTYTPTMAKSGNAAQFRPAASRPRAELPSLAGSPWVTPLRSRRPSRPGRADNSEGSDEALPASRTARRGQPGHGRRRLNGALDLVRRRRAVHSHGRQHRWPQHVRQLRRLPLGGFLGPDRGGRDDERWA